MDAQKLQAWKQWLAENLDEKHEVNRAAALVFGGLAVTGGNSVYQWLEGMYPGNGLAMTAGAGVAVVAGTWGAAYKLGQMSVTRQLPAGQQAQAELPAQAAPEADGRSRITMRRGVVRPVVSTEETADEDDGLIDQDVATEAVAPIIDRSTIEKQKGYVKLMMRANHLQFLATTGGGKTSWMHYLATTHAQESVEVVVLSKHASIGQFPGCLVVGQPSFIEVVSADITQDLNDRLLQYQTGTPTRNFPKLWIFVDEFASQKGSENFYEMLNAVLTEGRKVNVHMGLFMHFNRAGLNNIPGFHDLMKQCDVRILGTVDGSADDPESPRYLEKVVVTGGGREEYIDRVVAPRIPDPDSFKIDNGTVYTKKFGDRVDPRVVISHPAQNGSAPATADLHSAPVQMELEGVLPERNGTALTGAEASTGAKMTFALTPAPVFAPPSASQIVRPTPGMGAAERAARATMDSLADVPSSIDGLTAGELGAIRILAQAQTADKGKPNKSAICEFLWGSKNPPRFELVNKALGMEMVNG